MHKLRVYFSLRLKVTGDSDERVIFKYLFFAAHSPWPDTARNEGVCTGAGDYADAVHTLHRGRGPRDTRLGGAGDSVQGQEGRTRDVGHTRRTWRSVGSVGSPGKGGRESWLSVGVGEKEKQASIHCLDFHRCVTLAATVSLTPLRSV